MYRKNILVIMKLVLKNKAMIMNCQSFVLLKYNLKKMLNFYVLNKFHNGNRNN